MASLTESPPNRNGISRWIEPAPRGIAEWILCACMVVLAIPVVIVFGPIVWIIRAYDHLAGKVGA